MTNLPIPPGDDYKDAGGRTTQDQFAGGWENRGLLTTDAHKHEETQLFVCI